MRRITNILKKLAGPIPSVPAGAHVTIRHAHPGDADALAVLAKLDSSRPPRGAILVAEGGGELWAAISLDDNHLIANPFRPSGELAFSLLERAREIHRAERHQRRRAANVWPPPAPLGGSR
jgi:hypothetical protein